MRSVGEHEAQHGECLSLQVLFLYMSSPSYLLFVPPPQSCNTAIVPPTTPGPAVYTVSGVALSFNQQFAPLLILYACSRSGPIATALQFLLPGLLLYVLHASMHCCNEYALIPVMSPPWMFRNSVQS
jgi:hypothetical protein